MKHSRYETLWAFCRAMEWAADPEVVYARLIDVSCEYLECDAAYLHLLDADGVHFARYAQPNDASANAVGQYAPMQLSVDVGRAAWMIESRQLIVMDYEHPHANDVIPEGVLEAGFRSAISIPLCAASGVLGMLSIVYRRQLPWGQEDHGFLLEIGQALGTMIRRMQMSKKELELQILKERKQLSSEIHDNISQMVSAFALRVDIAQSCLEEGELDELGRELESLGKQARQVTKVLREEMLSLRASLEGVGDISKDLAEVFERFEEQWGISASLISRCEYAIISEYARLQLARIVNECLQNVLRHSRARNVYATLDRRNGHVLITIRDDGTGFNVEEVSPERLGLRIMRERALSAGGSLHIASGSTGTTVFIELPAVRLMEDEDAN